MESGGFKKRLSLLDLTFLGVGSIIGSGWLFAAANAAKFAGSAAWGAWVFGAVAVILIGLVYAELGAMFPRAGGFVRYPSYTHGSLVGYLIGFAAMLAYSSVAGVEVEAVRGYASHWWPALGVDGPTALGIFLQIVLLVVFFLINYWSVNVFGKINSIITTIKFLVPIITVIALFTQFKASNLSVGGASPGGFAGVADAVSTAGIVFAFLGFRQAVDFGSEAKNPQKDIPKAIIFAVIIGAVMYLLLQFAYLGAVPHAMLATGGWAKVSFLQAPFAQLATSLGMVWLANLIFVDAVISPSGTGNIYLSGTARTIFAWAKTGLFYSIFRKIDKRSGLPRGALWLTLILAIVWTLPLKFQVWQGLISAVTSATVLTYMVGPVSVAALRKNFQGERPFKLKGLSIISPLAFIAATWIIYWSGWEVDSLLIGMSIASLVLYFSFMDRDAEHHGRLKTDWKSGLWLIVYYVFLFIMSRIGTFVPKEFVPVIKSPWDSIIVAIGALIIYYWGVATALKTPQIDYDDEEDRSLKAANV